MSHKIVYDKWTFPADKIRDGNLYLATSLLASALEVNTLSATVECADPSILDFQRNAQLLYYARSDRPMVFRVQSILRVAPTLYALSCTSTLGLLTEGQHMGGIYTGQTAADLIASICGDVPYIVKSNLAGVKLYGWLPIAPPRDNLAQVLFALGATLKTDLDGILRIEGLWDGISGQVSKDNMYIDAAVDYSAKVTQVIVTEHQYIPWSEQTQLFEGTAQQGDIITFDEPMHTLTADGFSVLASGANWAQVSAGSGTLTGKTYIHNTRLIARDVQTANVPNVKTVDKATLVSLVNSTAVADRLAAFYKCTETINAPVVYHGENTGNVMRDYHPFDRAEVNACLQSADITLSGTLKAQEKSLVGFEPLINGKTETTMISVILSGKGIFKVPDGVEELEAVVIGAGGSGTDGSSGVLKSSNESKRNSKSIIVYKNSTASIKNLYSSTNAGAPSVGGDGGVGGQPGKVLEIKVSVISGSEIPYECGLGGSESGEAGGETTFGNYSSINGEIYANGYFDVVSNTIYAAYGLNGTKGGDGGTEGNKGEDVSGAIGGNSYTPSVVSDSAHKSSWDDSSTSITAQGFTGICGGGGAGGSSRSIRGANGGNATGVNNPFSFTVNSLGDSWVTVSGGRPGRGGDGANGRNGETYGSGGDGGGGGGGGGAYGKVEAQASASYVNPSNSSSDVTVNLYVTAYRPSTTEQGKGGLHGNGADGCIIVRYKTKKKIQSGQFIDKNGKHFLEKLIRRFIV